MSRTTGSRMLIEALEAVTRPSRPLDGMIWRAVLGGGGWELMETGEGDVWYRQDPLDLIAYEAPPPFTASLDAALTLVPEGLTWQVTGRVKEDGDFFADVDVTHECRSAPTPALALCIAAMKAREAKNVG